MENQTLMVGATQVPARNLLDRSRIGDLPVGPDGENVRMLLPRRLVLIKGR